MKKTHASTEYPIVIKQVKNSVVLSCPDFKQNKIVDLPEDKKITPEFLTRVAEQIGRIWLKNHMKLVEFAGTEIPPPAPSKIKSVLEKREEKLISPPELAELAGVSSDTIRRAIDRGEIESELTSGGHRRVTHVQAIRYLEKQGYSLEL